MYRYILEFWAVGGQGRSKRASWDQGGFFGDWVLIDFSKIGTVLPKTEGQDKNWRSYTWKKKRLTTKSMVG